MIIKEQVKQVLRSELNTKNASLSKTLLNLTLLYIFMTSQTEAEDPESSQGGDASRRPSLHSAGTLRGPHPCAMVTQIAGSTHLLPPRHLRKFVLYIAWMIIKTSKGRELKEAFD